MKNDHQILIYDSSNILRKFMFHYDFYSNLDNLNTWGEKQKCSTYAGVQLTKVPSNQEDSLVYVKSCFINDVI